jgi:hypothetical protein
MVNVDVAGVDGPPPSPGVSLESFALGPLVRLTSCPLRQSKSSAAFVDKMNVAPIGNGREEGAAEHPQQDALSQPDALADGCLRWLLAGRAVLAGRAALAGRGDSRLR